LEAWPAARASSEFERKSVAPREQYTLTFERTRYWKNATQQGLPLGFTNPRLWYRGLSTSVVNMATLTGLQFPLTSSVANVFTGGVDRPLADGEKIGAAFCGGFLSGLACGPFECTAARNQRIGTVLC